MEIKIKFSQVLVYMIILLNYLKFIINYYKNV